MIPNDFRPPYYLGVDLGGTFIKAGVVDDDGRAVSSVSRATEVQRGPEVGQANLADAAGLALAASGLAWDQIAAVGLGAPGPMDIAGGMLHGPNNLPEWVDWPVRDRLAETLGKPVVLQNDANAAAFGEHWVGAGRGSRSLVMFTLGTGIGCGIIEDGRIIEGRTSHGGEGGHIVIQMDGGRPCTCGQTGHLEAYASATALVERAVEAIEFEPDSSLRHHFEAGTLTSKAIAEAAAAGDRLATHLMRETARYLAVGAVSLIHVIDPDVVLFGGGMIAAGPTLLEGIRSGVRALAFPIPAAHVRIEYAELGGNAGFIGAAGCARQVFGNGRVG